MKKTLHLGKSEFRKFRSIGQILDNLHKIRHGKSRIELIAKRRENLWTVLVIGKSY